MDYLTCTKPPFTLSQNESNILISPHQTFTLGRIGRFKVSANGRKNKEINCTCLRGAKSTLLDEIAEDVGSKQTLIWVDPSDIPTECLASFIMNWKEQVFGGKNIDLAITVPDGDITENKVSSYHLWSADSFGFSDQPKPEAPIWFPHLARDQQALELASSELNPYDVFPLVEFPYPCMQWGERSITEHYQMLEQFRTRTRNFMYINSFCPDQAFNQFYDTLTAMKRSTSTSSAKSVITPGGSTKCHLTALLAGTLAESYFLTPEMEIPIKQNGNGLGIIVLRKCL